MRVYECVLSMCLCVCNCVFLSLSLSVGNNDLNLLMTKKQRTKKTELNSKQRNECKYVVVSKFIVHTQLISREKN